MWSGRKNNTDYFVKPVRGKRKPLDTDQEMHQGMDDALNKKFGFRGRSNAIFVTGDMSQSFSYGVPYMIFPVGKYQIAYSEIVRDFYFEIKSDNYAGYAVYWILWKHKDEVKDIITKEWTGDPKGLDYDILMRSNRVAKTLLKKYEKETRKAWNGLFDDIAKAYTNKDIKKAILSKYEIMLHCKTYLAISNAFGYYINGYFDTMGMKEPNRNNMEKAAKWNNWLEKSGMEIFSK